MKNSTTPQVLLLGFAAARSQLAVLRSILIGANVTALITECVPCDKQNRDRIPEMIARACPSLVILELSDELSAHDERVKELLELIPYEIPIIVTARDLAAEKIRRVLELGVIDFIVPPITSASVLPRVWRLLRHECDGEHPQASFALQRFGLLGESAIFRHEIEKLCQISRLDITVFIHGETGTGKELVARAIHYLSPRSKHPFVPIDCAAIPLELTESELFGHERGAFTGAVARTRGLISAADRGTLFLDEIDALSLPIQSKLLRFLQEREYRPLGSREIVRADVRIVSATNRDLRHMVHNKEFREDLYYRINVLQLRLPGLRQRGEDVALLARYFAAKYAARFKQPPREFSRAAMQALLMYKWPGNIRELENVVEAAVALGDGPLIRASDLVFLPDQVALPMSFQEAKAQIINDFEREYIGRLLQASGGNVSEAARLAHKNRRALWQLIRKHQINVGEVRESLVGAGLRKPKLRAGGLGERDACLKVAS